MTQAIDTLVPVDFEGFPKMARYSRPIVITEKIDGTNAQIFISDDLITVLAGSRNRWITPDADNFGFARWVQEHRDELLQLGPGRHFGEWWGAGIQRGYGLPKGENRFSLFNTVRWTKHGTVPKVIATADPRVTRTQDVLPACCDLVPLLYQGLEEPMLLGDIIQGRLLALEQYGSFASPGFMDPEGIVIFHTAANFAFKKTIKNDEVPKILAKGAK